MKNLKFVVLILFLSNCVLWAQEELDKNTMRDGTIDEQFQYVIKKSYKYSEGGTSYRVVKTAMINQLESNVDKAMDKLETDLNTSNQTIGTQASEIESLKNELKTTNDNLAQVTKEKNNMNLLGIAPMKKGVYRTIMWAIIAGLLAFLFFFIMSFWRSNAVTKQTKKLLEKSREEFDSYRKKAMEEEQVLRRKLQTEINKGL